MWKSRRRKSKGTRDRSEKLRFSFKKSNCKLISTEPKLKRKIWSSKPVIRRLLLWKKKSWNTKRRLKI